MLSPKNILLIAMLVLTAVFVAIWVRTARARRAGDAGGQGASPGPLHLAIGFVTNFFDTLGIGSFATTTTLYRLRRLVPDQLIPGTLNVGHTPPTIVQALIYITIVQVEFDTLLLLIIAAVGGSWIGAAIVSGLPRAEIQRGMGVALLVAALLMVATALNVLPLGGDALGLSGPTLILAVGINFVLGALMTLGIGAYAPIMIMVSLLGMNPTAAFPIMMGSCAFLMPVAGMQFVRKQKYHLRASVGLGLGGMPAVLIAALIVRSLPLTYVRWLVVIVVLYAATTLLRASVVEASEQRAPTG
ncbi:MAG: sulfite exporter TauE/SafE family protein [Acidimicrobiia bacterium]|nr:sulfite exporter TauE/SafE family protein [Acidimicrobiia bacterium]